MSAAESKTGTGGGAGGAGGGGGGTDDPQSKLVKDIMARQLEQEAVVRPKNEVRNRGTGECWECWECWECGNVGTAGMCTKQSGKWDHEY
jgi:hypothetical protein